MQHDFWLARWRDNMIGFHQDQASPALQRFYSQLRVAPGDRVFLPMCGKSLDMPWLEQQGQRVLGVELSPIAVKSFFVENGRTATVTVAGDFEAHDSGDIEILCGDYFRLPGALFADVQAVFDRASLIALPPDMRRRYANKMTELVRPGSRMLLVTMEYPQQQMDGPPFSVLEPEIRDLYGDHFSITVLNEEDILAAEPKFRDRGLDSLVEKTYLLQRE
jgi:thiopurine S-methyltransferase